MQRSQFQDIKRTRKPDAISVSAVLHAGNFDGHWLSDTDVTVESTLKNNAVELEVTAKNVGKTPLPMGVGWHPYFVIPSGDRKQALTPHTQRHPRRDEQLRRHLHHWPARAG